MHKRDTFMVLLPTQGVNKLGRKSIIRNLTNIKKISSKLNSNFARYSVLWYWLWIHTL